MLFAMHLDEICLCVKVVIYDWVGLLLDVVCLGCWVVFILCLLFCLIGGSVVVGVCVCVDVRFVCLVIFRFWVCLLFFDDGLVCAFLMCVCFYV